MVPSPNIQLTTPNTPLQFNKDMLDRFISSFEGVTRAVMLDVNLIDRIPFSC